MRYFDRPNSNLGVVTLTSLKKVEETDAKWWRRTDDSYEVFPGNYVPIFFVKNEDELRKIDTLGESIAIMKKSSSKCSCPVRGAYILVLASEFESAKTAFKTYPDWWQPLNWDCTIR